MPAAVELDALPRGQKANISSYSVQEDATTNDVSNFEGGAGQVTFTVSDFKDSHTMLGDVVTLTDGSRGRFQSVVRGLSGTDGDLTITGDSAISRLNMWTTSRPFQGTLGVYIAALFNLAGSAPGVAGYRVDPSISDREIVAPGFVGNLWDHMKMFLSSQQVELAQVYNYLVVRPLRTIDAFRERTITESYSLDNQTTAQKVEITYYNHKWGGLQEVYPVPGEDAQPLVVNANQAIVQDFRINGSLLAVSQPDVQAYVNNASYAGTFGVYAVAGNDGLPITPAQWTSRGGKLSVAITEDPSVIRVTVAGADIPNLSPFRIAMTAGTSSYYNSLRITGVGTTWDKKVLTLTTGAPLSATGETVGVTVDNPYIDSLAQAYTTGLVVAGAYSGPAYTVTGSTYSLNRPNADDSVISSTFADYNAANPGQTFSAFNTEWSGSSFQIFNDHWTSQAQNRFSNQLFGQGVGARLRKGDAYFRIDSTTTGPSSVDYSAKLDTTFGDFATALSGKTFENFNAIHAGKTFGDFAPVPLRTSP